MFDAFRVPRVEVLFGPTARGLAEALFLRDGQRHTYQELLDTLYPRADPASADQLADSEERLGEALDALIQEGFLAEYAVGEDGHYYQWQYALTPGGMEAVRRIHVYHAGEITWVRAVGSDGHLYEGILQVQKRNHSWPIIADHQDTGQ